MEIVTFGTGTLRRKFNFSWWFSDKKILLLKINANVPKMQFLKALFPSFYVWQFFSLSPFALMKNSLIPKSNDIHNYIAIGSVFIQLVVLIFGWFYSDHYVTYSHHIIILSISDIILMTLIRCTSISVVLESWRKRPLQMAFLTKIHQIDTIITSKLLIDLNYNAQRKKNLHVFIGFIVTFLSTFSSVMISSIVANFPKFLVFWALYLIPLFVCMIRYQQFNCYVRLIYDRYKAINDHVERLLIIKNRENSTSDNSPNLTNLVHIVHSQQFKCNRLDDVDIVASLVLNQIKHIQRVHRLLVDANRMLCQAFSWSMLFNVFNDFFNVLINLYWLVMTLLISATKVQLIGMALWAFLNIFLLVSLSNACQFACYEVIPVSFINHL